ncbi:methyltransferase [Marinospirillum sp.]|uniref:methyltransferase n=1 Tax=Marinospirillum sp. TaxID=2183934 RepID=UPI00384BDC45
MMRHLPEWQDQPLNLIAPPGHLQLAALQLGRDFAAPVQVWTADWRMSRLAQQQGLQSFFVSQQAPASLPGRSLVFWPKAKDEGYWWLRQLVAYSLEGFYLLGETQGGVKAAASQLQKAGLEVTKLDSARRCALYYVEADALKGKLPAGQETLALDGPDGLQLCSLPGVFGHGRVDEGSQLLLSALQQNLTELPQQGRCLDLGCGGGLLGAWLLQHNPGLQLIASDVSGFALQATQATLQANGLQGQTWPGDIFNGLEAVCQPGSLDLIVTNPPFHTGKATDYELSERLIRESPRFLKPGGQLWLVANRFLPYPDLLDRAFGSFQRRAETGKFSVYQALREK